MQLALMPPQLNPPPFSTLVPLSQLLTQNPDAAIVVMPECTATNGRGILPFSPSLLSAPPYTKIFPVNLRYTPGDITTPVPSEYARWLWRLCSKPTHCIRVRVAECVYNNPSLTSPVRDSGSSARATGTDTVAKNSYETNFFDTADIGDGSDTLVGDGDDADDGLTAEERRVLDRVAEDLARLGRVKRVGLGVKEKIEFVKVWGSRKR